MPGIESNGCNHFPRRIAGCLSCNCSLADHALNASAGTATNSTHTLCARSQTPTLNPVAVLLLAPQRSARRQASGFNRAGIPRSFSRDGQSSPGTMRYAGRRSAKACPATDRRTPKVPVPFKTGAFVRAISTASICSCTAHASAMRVISRSCVS